MEGREESDYERWHTGVGKGWLPLLEPLFNFCTSYHIKVMQVKEKFGGLRFYVGEVPSALWDEWSALCRRMEEKSLETCENCGAPGRTRGPGWIKTHCDACHLAWQRRP